MRIARSQLCFLLGLAASGTVARFEVPKAISRSYWHAISFPVLHGVQAGKANDRIISADGQPGGKLGAKIIIADKELGLEQGEIRVANSGEISKPVVLSQNHALVCVGDQTKIMMSTPSATIMQQSNTQVRGCTLVSGQVSTPPDGAEVFSHETSNIQIENVTFIGGGYHIRYDAVANFTIKHTRHVSITARGASPILIASSSRGRIISPRIEGYIAPVGQSGIRLIGISRSQFIDIQSPVIQNVDASTVPGCGGVSFTASSHSSVESGMISGLNNCDGVLTESSDIEASSDINISDVVSTGQNASAGAGKNSNNGEGFDIFNSERIELSHVTVRNNGKYPGNRQPGIEISNSNEIKVENSTSSDNYGDGIKVDGSRAVAISNSHTNHNGAVGILVMPALGRVRVTRGSPVVNWVPGAANMTFSAVWPVRTKILIGPAVYTIARRQSTTQLTLTTDVPLESGAYGYNVDSYVDISGGDSINNGQLSAGKPVDEDPGQREGVYFAGGFSREITGRVTGLDASDTQTQKTQTFGIRIENQARIIAKGNSLKDNMEGGIRDSPGKSRIH
jgi:Right handed beta helix region